MKEDIIRFPNNPSGLPFAIEMCGVTYPDPKYKINRPDSQIYCFEYIYKGKGVVKCGKTEFNPCGGDVYILPASLNHFYYSDKKDPWKKIWFNIKGDFIEKALEAYKLKNLYHIKNADTADLFENFLKNAAEIKKTDNGERNFDICASDFLKIIQKLSRRMNKKNRPDKLSAEEKLKKKIDNLEDFSQNFEELIEDLYYSKEHIIRTFKKRYDVTPYEYLLRRKIDAAEMLLCNTSMSITEISEYLSFSDSKTFMKFFKKRTGTAPGKYRK